MVGEIISHFKIEGKLGEGGMGVVYRGIDTDLDRPVAIKILTSEAQQNEESVGRFLREAKTASKLQHPAITTIYEFGVKDALFYLVMEYVDGKTLKEMLESGPLPIRQLLDIGIEIADALSLAGEKGIIHRDIKPENIMLTNRGRVKILDFGLAKMLEQNQAAGPDSFKTVDGRVFGTVKSMSPEQALGVELDVRTDIFSTGVVLYEMATGVAPFTGVSPNIVLAKILNQPPPPLSGQKQAVPPSLEKAIMKCLEKNRENRYQDAASLLLELRAIKQMVENEKETSKTVAMSPVRDIQSTPQAEESLRNLVTATGSSMPVANPEPTKEVVLAEIAATSIPATTSSGGFPKPIPAVTRVTQAPVPNAESFGPSLFSKAWRKPSGLVVSIVRKAINVAGALFAACCVAVFFLPVFKPEALSKMGSVVRWLHWPVDPVQAFLGGLFSVNMTFKNFDFLFLGMALGAWLLKLAVVGVLGWLEDKISGPLKKASAAEIERMRRAAGAGIHSARPETNMAQGTRTSLLRNYAASKKLLNEDKKELAFLSIDVVGSTKMKIGEDKIAIEHAFSEYKKFLERIFRDCHCWKVTWTPDGVMTAFRSVEDAATAGRRVLAELDWFNRDIHQLRTEFHVRCGLNSGEVVIPEDKPLEEVSDEVIDVAGHMQKYAEPDSMWLSSETFNKLTDRSGLQRIDKQVDNRLVFALEKSAAAKETS